MLLCSLLRFVTAKGDKSTVGSAGKTDRVSRGATCSCPVPSLFLEGHAGPFLCRQRHAMCTVLLTRGL